MSNMPWRKTGVKYAQNEIYLDIIEEIDAVVDANGEFFGVLMLILLAVCCKVCANETMYWRHKIVSLECIYF